MKKILFLLLSFAAGHTLCAQRSLPDRNARMAEALQQQTILRKEQAKAMFGHDSIAIQREFWRLDSLYQEELRHWEAINNPYFTQAKVKSSMTLDSTLSRVFDESTKEWIGFERSLYRYNDQDLLSQLETDTLISTTESEARTMTSFEYDQEGRVLSRLVKEYNSETGIFDERAKTEDEYPNEYTIIRRYYTSNPENSQLFKTDQITIREKPEEHWRFFESLLFNSAGDTTNGFRTTNINSPFTDYSDNYQWSGGQWSAMNKHQTEYDEDRNRLNFTIWESEGTQFTSSLRSSYEYEEGKKTAYYRSSRAHDEDTWKHNHFTNYAYNQGDTLMVENNFDKEGEAWVQYAKSFRIPSETGIDFKRYDIRNGEMYLAGGTETTLDEQERQTIVMNFYMQEGEKVPTYRSIYQYTGSREQESEEVYQVWREDSQQWFNLSKTIQSNDEQGRNLLYERYAWSTDLSDWEGSFKAVSEYNENGRLVLYESYSYIKESQSWLLEEIAVWEIQQGIYGFENYQFDYDTQKLVGTTKSLTESDGNKDSGFLEMYRHANWEWDVTKDDWELVYEERGEYYTGTQSLKWVDYYDRQYPEWARQYRIKYYYRDFEEENDDYILATDEAFGFQLMPNPATDYIRISGPAEVQELKIMNAAGQQVRTYHGGESHYFIGDLSAGVYHILLTSGSKQAVFKLLKQ
ncbi:T9SS type A sorting domain-containing protein [Persicobacter sp. CCB-QB2]|uniref:T9SS type A sorting domain-containing protein n=1 Tax=Persicobacter sp. CCB-QB2 TaxID=1561025 RepID=UPI0006A9822E|nr:T9SS type A sorting domain-containing protein [Persicobacter sp. CCB-QB2]